MTTEVFQPISVKPPSSNRFLFAVRCLVDLQLGSIVKYLRPSISCLHGDVLDVGAGESPWREWLPNDCRYRGLDVGESATFGMRANRPDITYYDGKSMPFSDSSFDGVMCIEVLEHAEEPELVVEEIARILKDEATLLLSVPWSARRHHIPHDYHRFTRERLEGLLSSHGFAAIKIIERGNDVGAIASKLIVLTIRLLKPVRKTSLIWTLPLSIPTGLTAACMLFAAHISDRLGLGSQEDPLGYFVTAVREAR
ncbi:class I SAM-dependent methyltransferase [Cupriavidus sp. UME77]|uniref:class I SAM-dependent methyltransferase n=1 Tax=Cupriavidus sp. UME77 TaxID=1862321 RepID=UPI0016049E08|nr:class I SAM-dependent methyltransferase [Cupriavidus sp. UME77]